MELTAKAQSLLALHIPGQPVVVPTVWDAWSAELVAEAGFAALTIGSHPAATAIGRRDGEDLTLDEMLERVALVARAVDIPVSADLESGYGAEPLRIIEGLLAGGAVGLNLEDTVHSEGGRLRSDREHADLIAEVRGAADATGVHVVINARTDLLHRQIGPAEDRVDRAIARLTAAASAGADVLYPVGMHDDDIQRRLTAELPLPVNALATPERLRYADLAASGVGRISFGPFLQRALGQHANQLLSGWLP